jgi:hypothetical protein
MSDDLVPEEGEQEYRQLLAMLRSSSHRRVPIAAREQAQIVTQVRERLARATSTSTLPDVGAFTPRSQFVPHLPPRQARTSTRFVNNLLAALVLIGLILGSWVLFRAYPSSSHRTPVSTVSSGLGPVAQTQVDGLETSMQVLMSGPYFLSELLPVDVSFTNHTQKPVGLDGSLKIENKSIANACFPPALLVQVTQGGEPSYLFPRLDAGCTQPYIVTEVEPGQTITIYQYVPLTRSEGVTLTRGQVPPNYTGDPLDRQWPTVHLHMQVNPQVPQDRALSLRSQGTQVMISVPAGAKPQLLSMQSITCDGYGGPGNPGQWTPLSTNVLHEPTCPTAHRHWTYVVSAPGYAIILGSQTA